MNEQSLNIRFVQEVEKYPCLYNCTLTDYSRKDVTESAWSAVGEVFNLPGSLCKEKWKNLRAVFVRHMKPSQKTKKPYYLSDAMQFTIPFIKVLNTNMSGNLPQVTIKEEMEQDEIEETNESFLMPVVSSPHKIMASNSCPLPASSPIYTEPLSPKSSPSSSSSDHGTNFRFENRKGKRPSTTIEEKIIDYFKAKKAKLEKRTENTDDPKRMFLLSLLPDIQAMNDSQTRIFKRRVLALVDEILDESPSI